MRFEEILVLLTFVTGAVCVTHYLYTHKARKAGKIISHGWLVDYSKSFFPVLILVLCLRSFLFEPFRIPTGSMKPTLVEGDFIIVNKFVYGIRLPILGTTLVSVSKPKVGDIIVFRHFDGKDLIKRVVGVPGDHVTYKDKMLYINDNLVPTEFLKQTYDKGERTRESREQLDSLAHNIYIYPDRDHYSYPFSDVIVPANSYFVLGDNRDNSEDGRFWGFVPEQDLLGKAVATWMSWNSDSEVWWDKIRWNKIGKSIYEYSN